MSDIFISYKAEDRRRVDRLVKALESAGLSVWWDAQLGGGAAWRQSIEQALEVARCVIVVWSKRSVGPEGAFVHDEAARAMERGVYLPVTIDTVRPPLGFGERQALSLVRWQGDAGSPQFQTLLEAISSFVAIDYDRRPAARRQRFDRRTLLIASTASATVIGAGGWYALRSGASRANGSIAVMPFANLSGDPGQAYFADGIAEELRASLSRLGLRVIGRASSDAVRNVEARDAAKRLDAAHLLTGSVRRSPSLIRISAQLVDGSSGVERWAHSYDRAPGDVLKIQSDISDNVAQSLSIALGKVSDAYLRAGGTRNVEAHDLFLQSNSERDSDNEEGIRHRVSLLDRALALDPNYAQAMASKAILVRYYAAGYARTAELVRSGLADALELANRAIAIAPEMPLGRSVRGSIYGAQLRMGLALADARRAETLPGGRSVEAMSILAVLLSLFGLFDEALQRIGDAVSLDPLNPLQHNAEAIVRYNARQYDLAIVAARRALALSPNGNTPRDLVARSLVAKGDYAGARTEWRHFDPNDFQPLLGEAIIAARTGQHAAARERLEKMRAAYGDAAHFQYAEVAAELGSVDEAFAELEKAWLARDTGLPSLRVHVSLDRLRKDPRFAVFERRLGFDSAGAA